jgi:hypothetical protein
MPQTDIQEVELADNGAFVPVGSLAMTVNRNADGTVNYFQCVYQGVTYRKTYSYTAGIVTSWTAWTHQ